MSSKCIILVVALACVGETIAQVYKASSPSSAPAQEIARPEQPEAPPKNDLITQTVYGFLDFTTTIGNTVMVFSPQSAPPEGSKNKVTVAAAAATVVQEKSTSLAPIETKPSVPPKKVPNIQASKTHKNTSGPETKKQAVNNNNNNNNNNKGTKVIVNSVTEQHNSRNDSPVKTEKLKSHVEATTASSPAAAAAAALSSVIHVDAQSRDTPGVKNNLAEPEYDFLSKQPTEVVDETYKLINLKPSSKVPPPPLPKQPRASPKREKENPTGLVTKLGGTIVKEGLTTVHETSVIGTYINGKYAQVLQSTSRILKAAAGNAPSIPEGKIRASNTLRILKTIGPQHGKLKPQLEPTPTRHQEESSLPLEGLFNAPSGPVRTTRRHSANHQLRPKFRNKIIDDPESNEAAAASQQQQQQQPRNLSGKNRPTNARPMYKNRQITTTSEGPPTTRRRSGFRPSNGNQLSQPAKSIKSRPEVSLALPSTSSSPSSSSSSSPPNPVLKMKLPRTQGRWSYKTTPKPRIAIRKQVEDEERSPLTPVETSPLRTNEASAPASANLQSEDKNQLGAASNGQRKSQDVQLVVGEDDNDDDDDELDPSETEEFSVVQEQQQQQQQEQQQSRQQQQAESILPVETINIEISTPADFDNVYFEIATIKSPYTFQVGTMKNTRYVTVTSTIKKSFASAEVPSPSSSPPPPSPPPPPLPPTNPSPSGISPSEPLTENILARNTGAAYESSLPLDSSIATLPPITLESGQATPPLETLTETFSTTQTLLKTHMLPVVSGGETTRLTLVQTYNVARVVTATKTLPPMEIYQFIPSKTLNEFNSKLDEAGSELHLELDFGDDEQQLQQQQQQQQQRYRGDDEDTPKRVVAPSDTDFELIRHQVPSPVLGKANRGDQRNIATSPVEPQLTPEQIQQLALLKYFGAPPQQPPPLQQQQQQLLSPQGALHQAQVITTSRPVIVLETVYESRVIPLINGANTIYSTLSRAIATVPRTSYEYGTSSIAPIIPQQQVPHVPHQLAQLYPQPQPQFTVTSAPHVAQTLATLSESRVLKLTFGAKTAYTTLFSTRVVPTEVTTYVTSTVPVQPTVQAFPGYFPPPVGYPPFPYVG